LANKHHESKVTGMPHGRGRVKKRGLRVSTFEKYAIALPKTAEARAQRGKALMMNAARPLAIGEGPLSVRSAAMIHQMRQGLKLAIKELRGDMTQAAFARRIGITQAALARMESLNNEVFPSTPLLIRIALVSSRDLRVSFVKRTMDAYGADMLSVDTAGFPTSAESGDYRVVIQDRRPGRAPADTVFGIRPIHAAIEKA